MKQWYFKLDNNGIIYIYSTDKIFMGTKDTFESSTITKINEPDLSMFPFMRLYGH